MIPEFTFTKPMLNAASDVFIHNIQAMTLECLDKFPELDPHLVKFSYTSGFANAQTLGASPNTLKIGYNPKCPLYYKTLGHELMHFAQEFTNIPAGEKSCDIYTLARSDLFLDRAPGYLHLPQDVRDNWDNYAADVRKICIQAIEIRKTNRMYIKWAKNEMLGLVK